MDTSKITKAIKQLALGSISSAGTTASIASVVDIPMVKEVLVHAAWASLGLGLAASAAWMVARSWPPQAITSPDVATERDLPQIHKMAMKQFGPKVTTVDLMRQWMKRNPNIFEIVTRVRHAGRHRLSTVDGYYCAVPVTEKAAHDLIAETRGINDILPEEVCRPSEAPYAVYVGAIACGTDVGKQMALQGLRRMVKRFARNRADMLILTRPITDDGLRLVAAFGFQPVRTAADNPMGVLHVVKARALFPRKRSGTVA